MPRYLDMLRAKNIFGGPGRRPLGMPDIDNSSIADMFRSVTPLANSLKNRDMQRQKEMMEFEASLRRKQNPMPVVQPTNHLNPKLQIVGGTQPLSETQQRFRNEDEINVAQKNRMAQIGATQAGSLNNALATGRQRDEADMARTTAEINGRSSVAASNRASIEKAAGDARTDKAKTDEIARTQKGPLVNVPHPRTGQMESRQYNPVTRKYEGITIDDDQAGTGYKQGTIPKPVVNPGQDPTALKAIRESAQSALDELNQLVDEKGDLRQHTADATGKSRLPGKWADAAGFGSLTPSTTKGTAGINALKSKLVLETIGKMKAQSKTGATGFGAMNLKELGVLENAASKLGNQDLSDDAFKEEFQRIKERLNMILQDSPGSDSSDADKRADELIKKYGGS